MPRMLRPISAVAVIGAAMAALITASAAFADGPPETPRREAAAQQPPVRAAPLQPTQPTATQAPPAVQPPAQAAAAPQTGALSLAGGAVSLNVPTGFEFWSAAEAQAYLQRANAVAPSGEVLGMIAPSGTQPTQGDFWGTVVSYEPIGHVPADTAASLQAASLEADVRNARQAAQRPFEGFVMQPAFDAAGGSLSWAERTAAAPAANVRDFRHEQRVLGRAGVVSLTTVARSEQQGAVVSAAPSMLAACSFPNGQRYADFNAASDNRSGYTLGDLVKGTPSSTPAEAAATSVPNALASKTDGAGSGLQGWFPWIAVGVVALAAIGWFAMGRRNRDIDDEDDEDEDQEEVVVAERKDEPKPEAPPATA